MKKGKIFRTLAIAGTCLCAPFLLSGCTKDAESQVEFRVQDGYIQVTEDGNNWQNLIDIDDLKGEPGQDGVGVDGKQVQFKKTSTHIQWRYVGETSWKNLVELSEIKGDAGEDASVETYTVELNFTTPKYWRESSLNISGVKFSELIEQNGIVEDYNHYYELDDGYTYSPTNDTFSYDIESNKWLGDKLPDFKNTRFEDYFLGWYITGTDIEVTKYSFIGGDVSIEIKWDEENMQKYLAEGVTFGYVGEHGASVRIESPYTSSKLEPSFIIIPEYIKTESGDIPVQAIADIKYENPQNVRDVIMPETVELIGKKAFYNCSMLVYYGEVSFQNVKSIDESAFEGTNFSGVQFNSSVLTIENNAFKNCLALREIRLSLDIESITIGENAFSGCTNLNKILVNNEKISNEITSNNVFGGIFDYCEVVYISKLYSVINSTYLLENFTKQATSDKTGYDMYVRNDE